MEYMWDDLTGEYWSTRSKTYPIVSSCAPDSCGLFLGGIQGCAVARGHLMK